MRYEKVPKRTSQPPRTLMTTLKFVTADQSMSLVNGANRLTSGSEGLGMDGGLGVLGSRGHEMKMPHSLGSDCRRCWQITKEMQVEFRSSSHVNRKPHSRGETGGKEDTNRYGLRDNSRHFGRRRGHGTRNDGDRSVTSPNPGEHVHRLLHCTCGSRYPYLVCGAGGVGALVKGEATRVDSTREILVQTACNEVF